MGNGIIEYLIESVLNVIYCTNETCLICNDYLVSDGPLCKSCSDKIEYCNDAFELENKIECYSAAYYASCIKEMIRRLKYKSDFALGEFLGEMLLNTVKKNNIEFDLITYVPLSKKAYRKRGFNQSEFLARYISKGVNRPMKELLRKKKDTKDQIGLDGYDRWQNMLDCFEALNYNLDNKKVILIDDVITTGATAFHCSKQLFKSGAEKVSVLTVAKSRL
ncbi:ComF family protein [Candidatus Clostridium stratigraminis]|uniref:ComF family protein n=1 Tax=Candidatus Clostridium stratigraminis TaxID=3381661 RepID=A0ABW8T0N0_9CLOT